MPLLDSRALRALFKEYDRKPRAVMAMLISTVDNLHGYGCIARSVNGEVLRIVEKKGASDEKRKVTEINSGAYVFDAETLAGVLKWLDINNTRGRLYLTDVISVTREANRSMQGYRLANTTVVTGVNDRVQLTTLGREPNRCTYEAAVRGGAIIVDPDIT